jgi:cytochrome c6
MTPRNLFCRGVGLALCLTLAACQGGGGAYPAAAQVTTPAPEAAAEAPAYATGPGMMGPGMQQNFGMMSNNVNQMHQMMGQGNMGPQGYGQMMGMMGQMGGMMQEMGGPNYSPETEQRQRQQLQEMQQHLGSLKRQGKAPEASAGAQIFASHCAVCHPSGGNILNPNRPLAGAPQLKSFHRFRALVRSGRGAMPAFSSGQISESQMRQLYHYAASTWGD